LIMIFDLNLFRKINLADFATDYATGGYLYPPLFAWRRAKNYEKLKSLIIKALRESRFNFSIYAHFPFCLSRCSFCRFYSLANKDPADYDAVLKAMIKELERWAGLIRYSRHIKGKIPLESIYMGGGTPTLFNLEIFFKAVKRNFDITRSKQINLESSLQALNERKLRLYKNFGVNRLLIGVQSLDPLVLKAVSRFSGQASVLEKVYVMAKKIGIPAVTFELIAGLPRQTKESFKKDLLKLIKLKPEGIHIYPLMFSPLSSFGGRWDFRAPFISKNAWSIFREGEKILAKNGYIRKGDEWILPGKEKARNFQLAVSRPNLIAVGPSAQGSIKTDNYNLYFSNILDACKYRNLVATDILPAEKYFILRGRNELARRELINQMRFSCVENWSEFKKFGKELDFLKKQKIVETTNHGLKISQNETSLYTKVFYSPAILKRCENIIKRHSQ